MSSLGLSQEELKAVEQTRQRLAQLSASLNSLKSDVFLSNPLPNLDSLQASADILNHNVHAILEIMAQNNDLFGRVAVHPSTNFPGRTQENVLLQLLRKKPEPDVEAAMEEGVKALASMPFPGRAQSSTTTTTANGDKEKEDALENIWTATRQMCQERIAEYVMNEESDSYTAEERELGIENVRTGLQRNLDDDSEDDEDDMDIDDGAGGNADVDLMIIDRPPPPPAPAISTQEVDGATPEVVLRIATRECGAQIYYYISSDVILWLTKVIRICRRRSRRHTTPWGSVPEGLLQGSFQLPDVYGRLVTALKAKGYPVVHPVLPSLTGQDEPDFSSKDLSTDATAIENELRRLVEDDGKHVVVLMHSYGGLVGSEATPEVLMQAKRAALNLPGGVIHLFYFAAFILSEGQSVIGVFGESPNNDVRPDGRFRIKNAAKIIYSDLPAEEAEYWESRIVDQSYAVQTTKMTREAYRYCPSTYVVCENDQGPPPKFQEMFGKAANSNIIKISSGHSPMLSKTGELADLVDVAAKQAMQLVK
ncbi:hypothetical protein CIB48_g11179 [Xylaria polymorpha]|nr:hypothetical protein CIB48_g11179 [Xylaria polymorpha]